MAGTVHLRTHIRLPGVSENASRPRHSAEPDLAHRLYIRSLALLILTLFVTAIATDSSDVTSFGVRSINPFSTSTAWIWHLDRAQSPNPR